MKILILTGVFLGDVGGPPTLLKALNKELIKRGWQVKILTFGAPKEARKYSYPVKAVCDKWPSPIKSFCFL